MGLSLLSPAWERVRAFQRERLRKIYEQERHSRYNGESNDDYDYDLNRKTFFHDWFSLANLMKRSDEKVNEKKNSW
jgi:hypothetical protein